MFDATKFYEDHNIDYFDSSYPHKHTRRGWVQIPCPRCTGTEGLHLGYNLKQGYYTCYRCKGMSVKEAIRLLLNVSWKQAQVIQEQYGGLSESKDRSDEAKKEKNIDVLLPQGTRDLQKPHKKYLIKRGFDPKELERIWNIKGTGPLGRYSHRIIAPIYLNKILVSYQGRDITNKSDLKYKACSIERERVHHKYIGYGYDLTNKKECLIVEGVFDAWRMGAGSVALFGTGYTPQQVQFLSTFKRIFILFDSGEEEAQKNGYKLSFELQELGVESEQIILDYEGDPAELSQKEADYIMRELLLR